MNPVPLLWGCSALLLVLGFYALRQRLLTQLQRHFAAPRTQAQQTPETLGVTALANQLHGPQGKRLFAWLLPGRLPGQPAPTLILLHGWGGNTGDLLPLAALLQARGYTVVLLDARGHGRSDDEAVVSLPRFAEDLACAVDWAKTRPEVDARRLALLGHSVGAAAALLVASQRDDLAAVVSLAAFAHPGRLMRQRLAALHLPYWPLGWYALRLVEQRIGARLDAIAPENTIIAARCPVLLMHGTADRTVPVSDARRLYRRSQLGRHPARLVLLAGDHARVDDWHGGLAALEAFLAGTVFRVQFPATGASRGCSSPD